MMKMNLMNIWIGEQKNLTDEMTLIFQLYHFKCSITSQENHNFTINQTEFLVTIRMCQYFFCVYILLR